MRDAKLFQIYEGTSQIQRLVIAKEIFLPRMSQLGGRRGPGVARCPAVTAGVSTARRSERRHRATRSAVRRVGLLGGHLACGVAVVGLAFADRRRRLAEGTTVAGHDIGGLTADEAARRSRPRPRGSSAHRSPSPPPGARGRLPRASSAFGSTGSTAVRVAAQEGDGFRPVRGLRRLQVRFFGAEVAPSASSFASVLDYEVASIARRDRSQAARAVTPAPRAPIRCRSGSTGRQPRP